MSVDKLATVKARLSEISMAYVWERTLGYCLVELKAF